MGKIKIYENQDDFLELSDESLELLLCKNVVTQSEFTQFIFDNFEGDRWLKNQERKKIFNISKIYWNKFKNTVPSLGVFKEIFKNKKFEAESSELNSELDNIVNYDDSKYSRTFTKNALISFTKQAAIYFAMLDKIEQVQSTGEVGDLVQRFEKIIQIDISEDIGIEYFSNLNKHCEEIQKKTDRTPFLYEELDKCTYGGLPSNDTCLFVLMAQPGLGKSMFMMNIARNWVLQNKKVLVLSLEMSEDMYSRRFDGLFADLNINKLRENVDLLKARVKGVKAGIPNGELRIKEFPTGTLTTLMIRQYLKKLESSNNFIPDIIFVDYLNIMKPNSYSSSTSLYEKCAKISEELRALSMELKKPIITSIQANRSGSGGGYAGENIDMSNVSESAGITATADALMALYQVEGERELGRMNMKILKNRLGGWVGVKIPFAVDYDNSLRITNWVHDEEINDDVLGTVNDASDKIFTGTKQNKQNNMKNTLEDA